MLLPNRWALELRMVANIVLNASTTAASGANLEISSAAEVVRPTSRPLGPNGFTQLTSVLPFNGPAAESASLTASHGTERSRTSAKRMASVGAPDRARE